MSSHQVSALLDRARSGDVEAFEQLIGPQLGRLHNYLARMVGDAHEAEDLTQEAVLRAHRAIRSFRGGATFQTWLYRIATNIAVDALRKRRRRESRMTSLDAGIPGAESELPWEIADTQRDPQETAEVLELAQRVQAAIDELSPKLKAVVVLFDVQGLSYDEIAETLGLPLGTVKSRLFNARLRLKEQLAPYVLGTA
jgi:RNA polymerase sigma-70 factor (ECF subfamily)